MTFKSFETVKIGQTLTIGYSWYVWFLNGEHRVSNSSCHDVAGLCGNRRHTRNFWSTFLIQLERWIDCNIFLTRQILIAVAWVGELLPWILDRYHRDKIVGFPRIPKIFWAPAIFSGTRVFVAIIAANSHQFDHLHHKNYLFTLVFS